jgi:hypothetical protein
MKFRALIALIVCIFGCSLQGQDQSAPVALSIPDIEVVNQDGQHLRFNSQVVDGRIAIVTGFLPPAAPCVLSGRKSLPMWPSCWARG